MNIKSPERTVFYAIEEAIKEYRKFASRNIVEIDPNITLDQALVLMILDKSPDLSQREISRILFKDFTSITRMVETLVKKKYLVRGINKSDRRKFTLKLTPESNKLMTKLIPIISGNRLSALNGITNDEIIQLMNTLNKITNNCKD